MSDLLNLTLPLFLLIAIGFGAVRSGLFDERDVAALGEIFEAHCVAAVLVGSMAVDGDDGQSGPLVLLRP
jgi:hypothetical protein